MDSFENGNGDINDRQNSVIMDIEGLRITHSEYGEPPQVLRDQNRERDTLRYETTFTSYTESGDDNDVNVDYADNEEGSEPNKAEFQAQIHPKSKVTRRRNRRGLAS